MPTRRSFLRSTFSSLTTLGVLGGGLWLFRNHVLWPAPDLSFTGAEQSTGWLPFGSRPSGDLIVIRAAVNGTPVNALLDSGAQYSAMDAAFADRLDLRTPLDPPLVAYGVGGGSQVARGARADITIGQARLSGLTTAVVALGPIAQATGLETPLILGQDVLQALVADIDFPRRRVRLVAPDALDVPPGAEAAPVERQGRALAAEVALDGVPLRAVVDTGSSSVIAVAEDVAREAGLLTGRTLRSGTSVVLGGVARAGVFTAGRFSFAGVQVEGVEVTVYQRGPVPGFPKALLGAKALADSRVFLDAARGRMHLLRT